MTSERVTENIVRDLLRKLGYYDNENIIIEEQKSEHPIIQKCLKKASKSGGGGYGKPEFIIRCTTEPEYLIVIECKSDGKYHQSISLDKYTEYAVDGVLNYAAYLSNRFNVIAIGISGQKKEDILISTYLWLKSSSKYTELKDLNEKTVKNIISFEDYIKYILFNPDVEKINYNRLINFSKDLHNYMRDYAKLSEAEKPLLVSGILIAFRDNAFSRNYKEYNQETELSEQLFDAIKREIHKAKIPKAKKENIIYPYSFVKVHPTLTKINSKNKETPLYRIISDIETYVKPFITIYQNYDVIGQFYGEFLRYTGGDKKGLGIVLTPKHVTELFAKIADLSTDDKVIDICAGTGGFLIASMTEMIRKSKDNNDIERIKKERLFGIEQRPNMFALAASNMILRGDGKANLYLDDCYNTSITKEIKNIANVGMINPSYSQKGEELQELSLVNHLLNCISQNGIGIAIVPISCTSHNPLKKKLLEKHRLDAVMSMPIDLFQPGTNIVTCIMVFKAHVPHKQNPHHKTWFGYWRNDGFILTKHKGRIDGGKWKEIEKKWLDTYFAKVEIPEYSILKRVTDDNEWCAEAYLKTDYSDLSEEDFVEEMKKYTIYKIRNDINEIPQ